MLGAYMTFELSYLVTDVSRKLNEIVFDGYVSGPRDVLPSAAYVTNLPDQRVVEVVQQTPPLGPVLSMCTCSMSESSHQLLVIYLRIFKYLCS